MPAPDATPLLLPTADYTAEISTVTTAANLLRQIIGASDFLQRICKRRFDECIATRKYTARHVLYGGNLLDSYTLVLDHDLKSVTTFAYDVAVGAAISSGTAITSGYQLVEIENNYGVTASRKIALDRVAGSVILSAPSYDPLNSIQVAGVWGYGGQWINSSATVSGLSSGTTATSATVSSATPFEAGQVWKIDSEYIYLDSISGTTATITRAVNGSTAATHSDGTTIYHWRPMQIVKNLVRRLVQWGYEQMKAPMAGAVTIGEFEYPVDTSGLPKDIYKMIADSGLQYTTIRLFK